MRIWIGLFMVGCRTPHAPEPVVDADRDGWAVEEDCRDDLSAVHPGQLEVCNGIDDDCDGSVDGDDVIGGEIYFADGDGDGWGAPATQIISCGQPEGYVRQDGDCKDGDVTINPGAPEVCDRIDQNCNGEVDENATDARVWFVDADDDGAGDFTQTVLACEQRLGIVANADDCDDDNAEADGLAPWYLDQDQDGFGDAMAMILACHQPADHVEDNSDCDDTNALRNPDVSELCNSLDDDCDGSVDENAVDAAPWFLDYDGDGFGSLQYTIACQAPTGYAILNSDCDDQDAEAYPYADEWCNGVDNDCDGDVDNAAIDQLEWFLDGDGDGSGDPTNITLACQGAADQVEDDRDCDDSDGAVSTEQLWYLDWDGDGTGDASMPYLACHAPPQYVADGD